MKQHVYHLSHIDLDGYGCQYLTQQCFETIECYNANYGPEGQISMMHQELVEKRRWISEHRFLHALNYTMVLPGPEAQQLATYIG